MGLKWVCDQHTAKECHTCAENKARTPQASSRAPGTETKGTRITGLPEKCSERPSQGALVARLLVTGMLTHAYSVLPDPDRTAREVTDPWLAPHPLPGTAEGTGFTLVNELSIGHPGGFLFLIRTHS